MADVPVPAGQEQDVRLLVAEAVPLLLLLPRVDSTVAILDCCPLGDHRAVLVFQVLRGGRGRPRFLGDVGLLDDFRRLHPCEHVILLGVHLLSDRTVPCCPGGAPPAASRTLLVGVHRGRAGQGQGSSGSSGRGPRTLVNVKSLRGSVRAGSLPAALRRGCWLSGGRRPGPGASPRGPGCGGVHSRQSPRRIASP